MFLKDILLVFILYKLNSCQDNNTTYSVENTTIITSSSELTSFFDNLTILVSSSEMNNETTSIQLYYTTENTTQTSTPSIKGRPIIKD